MVNHLFSDQSHKTRKLILIAELLTTARELASFSRPPKRDYTSVKSYFDENGPVVYNEGYIYLKEDIITIKPGREKALLDVIILELLKMLNCRLTRVRVSSLPRGIMRFTDKTPGISLSSARQFVLQIGSIN